MKTSASLKMKINERICHIVKVFTVAQKGLCYDPVFCYLSACLYKEFGSEDAYVFMHFIVKKLYPKGFFSPLQNFRAKLIETQSFAKMANLHSTNLSKNLTTNKRVLDCINCSEEEIESKYAFDLFCKKVSDAFLAKLFAPQINQQSLLKLLDMLFLEGYEFIHKCSLFIVNKMQPEIVYYIKNCMKGLEASEDNLSVAAIVSTQYILKPFSKCTFAYFLKNVYKDKVLEKFWNQYREGIHEEASSLPALKKHVIKESRLARIIKTKADFMEYEIELKEGDVAHFNQAFEDHASNEKLYPNGLVPYENFANYLTKKKGPFKWNINLVNSLFVTIDGKLKGAVSASEFKAILVLISEIGHNDKLFMICGLLEPTE